MRIFIRVLLTLYIIFVLCIAVVTMLSAWNVIVIDYTQSWLDTLYASGWAKIIVTIIAIVVIIVSFMLMFARTRKREPKSALITTTETGSIAISLSAVEEMATKHMLKNDAVKSAKVNVSVKDSKIDISSKLTVAEGSNIPEVLSSLQLSTKQEVETYAGVSIGKISVLVERTMQVVKARVE